MVSMLTYFGYFMNSTFYWCSGPFADLVDIDVNLRWFCGPFAGLADSDANLSPV